MFLINREMISDKTNTIIMKSKKRKHEKGKHALASKIIVMIVLAELGGVIGATVTFPAIGTWYAALNKPAFSPPNWIFGPVWIVLYALMGIAAALVWNSKSKIKQNALLIYGVQLALNVFWSIIFFGMHLPAAAFVEILALWLSIIATIIVFRRISRTAEMLLIPYIIWVTIAMFLNYSIMIANM